MIKYLSSVLFVKDIAASRQFYCDLLDQQVDIDFGVNVGFKGGFAIWQAEHAQSVMFDAPQPDSSPLGRRNLELYFETEDLDSTWERLSGTSVVHPVREQPWGQRVFRVYDPDGHIVEVGEPMPAVIPRMLAQGMTAQEVANRTGMPLEIVTLQAS